ncbi:NADH dehydrogenase subunit E [Antarctobacter heliothermus]|uniref:NADH dehydrogenase subunit E n=1 Tax=Antarctobacter heliothermus TaxID=74033 RepID=A0A222E6A2_9RHOB|nr:DUF5333 domain-containing protein [Antarctobacter heliothermus]ASP21743.1 NADH dehydrogenase subunit E [Antarctobacter heliothermus]
MRLFLTPILCLTLATPVWAKTPLNQVSEIDDGLMAIAIADEIRKNCNDISARMIRAYRQIQALEKRAKALGYSDDEIDTYVNSSAEKKRMRKKAETWLASKGVAASDEKALCKFGRDDIARGGPVGFFLR